MAKAPKYHTLPRTPAVVKPVEPPKFEVHKHLREIFTRPEFVAIDELNKLSDLTREQDLLQDLRSEALQQCRAISEFVEGVIENPHYQFGWAQRSFEVAAKLDVVWRLLDFLTRELKYEGAPTTFLGRVKDLQAELRDQVMRAARSPSQSTSATSNLSELMLTAAKADMVEKLEWFIRRKEA